MKNNIFSKLFLALIMLLGIISCEDRETVVVDNQAAPIVLDLSAQNVFLDQYFPGNPALTLTWDVAKYSVPVEVKYRMEASANANFTNLIELGTVNKSARTATFTVEQLNKIAGTLGFAPSVASKMYIRVVSYLGDSNIMEAKSNTTSVMITPYVLSYPNFYLVGAATAVGWNAGSAQVLYKDKNLSYIYTYVQPDSFRFLGQQDWNPTNYSIDAPGIKAAYKYFKQVPSTIAADGDENMKFSGTAGIYKVTINATVGVQTLDIVKSPIFQYDIPTVYLVGNIGGNNWTPGSAIAMTKIGEGVYEYTATLAADTEFKILGQQAWGDLEWGNIKADNNGYTGFLGPKGDNGNIKFNGGGASHKITVDLKMGTIKIVKL